MKTDNEPSGSIAKKIARETAQGFRDELRVALKWGFWGAVLGSALLGGAGFWIFGFNGLWIGALAGAILGGVGAFVFYLVGDAEAL